MNEAWRRALSAGFERAAAGAELLDRINVFPVADGDTGRNLKATLLPLRDPAGAPAETARALLMSARGNSGNIAAHFFAALLEETGDVPARLLRGRERARKAVADPRAGTMLTVLDALAERAPSDALAGDAEALGEVLASLEEAVLETNRLLPKAREAGVVDAGALGMFLFWEGAFDALAGAAGLAKPAGERFAGLLDVAGAIELDAGYCVDVVLKVDGKGASPEALEGLGESVVALAHEDIVKVHLHTDDRAALRRRLAAFGEVVSFASDDLAAQTRAFARPARAGALHVMTDAAGSLTREEADALGATLLESYVFLGERCIPETQADPAEMYALMRAGVRVSTSQASVAERRQCYEMAVARHGRVLYLCVGSVYTGNFQAALDWMREKDPDGRMILLDTGAASGRLGLLATATAERALSGASAEAVEAFARAALPVCREFVFLDTLKYLAAGGRVSKPAAFFGDALRMKPVITPAAEGAKKVAVLRNRDAQTEFALARLEEAAKEARVASILLEHSDNEDWVAGEPAEEIARRWPGATLRVRPLSLTSGAHMGPGTWAVAFLPEIP